MDHVVSFLDFSSARLNLSDCLMLFHAAQTKTIISSPGPKFGEELQSLTVFVGQRSLFFLRIILRRAKPLSCAIL